MSKLEEDNKKTTNPWLEAPKKCGYSISVFTAPMQKANMMLSKFFDDCEVIIFISTNGLS